MDFKETLKKIEEATLTYDQQKAADMKKAAIAAAKKKDPSLANISDDDFDYDPKTNTVTKMKLSTTDLSRTKNVIIKK